jgi:polyphosphate kinase 2 (PPK2 family)
VPSATSTAEAPWYIVPANHKWNRNLVVADRVVYVLESMDLRIPAPPPEIVFRRIRID